MTTEALEQRVTFEGTSLDGECGNLFYNRGAVLYTGSLGGFGGGFPSHPIDHPIPIRHPIGSRGSGFRPMGDESIARSIYEGESFIESVLEVIRAGEHEKEGEDHINYTIPCPIKRAFIFDKEGKCIGVRKLRPDGADALHKDHLE